METKAANVFGSQDRKVETLNYDTLDAASINAVDKGNYTHAIDKMKQK